MLRPVVLAGSKGWLACIEDEQGNIVSRAHPPLATEQEAQEVARAMLPNAQATQGPVTRGPETLPEACIAVIGELVDSLRRWTERHGYSFTVAMAMTNLESAKAALQLEVEKGET